MAPQANEIEATSSIRQLSSQFVLSFETGWYCQASQPCLFVYVPCFPRRLTPLIKEECTWQKEVVERRISGMLLGMWHKVSAMKSHVQQRSLKIIPSTTVVDPQCIGKCADWNIEYRINHLRLNWQTQADLTSNEPDKGVEEPSSLLRARDTNLAWLILPATKRRWTWIILLCVGSSSWLSDKLLKCRQ